MSESEDTSESDSASEEDQSSYEEQPRRPSKLALSGDLFSSALSEQPDWTPPVIHKSPEQRERIRHLLLWSLLFSALPEDRFNEVLDAFHGPHEIRKGTDLIRQGDEFPSGERVFFVLEAGELEIQHEDVPDGRVIKYDRPGQTFGELALLRNSRRAAIMTATVDSVLWSIDRDTFDYCIKDAHQAKRAEHEQFLASTEFMQSLDRSEFSRIVTVMEPTTYQKGDAIIRQGEQASAFFFVHAGSAYAARNGKRVKEYAPGDHFGFVKRHLYSAAVIADSSPTRVLALDFDSLDRFPGPIGELLAEREREDVAMIASRSNSQITPSQEEQRSNFSREEKRSSASREEKRSSASKEENRSIVSQGLRSIMSAGQRSSASKDEKRSQGHCSSASKAGMQEDVLSRSQLSSASRDDKLSQGQRSSILKEAYRSEGQHSSASNVGRQEDVLSQDQRSGASKDEKGSQGQRSSAGKTFEETVTDAGPLHESQYTFVAPVATSCSPGEIPRSEGPIPSRATNPGVKKSISISGGFRQGSASMLTEVPIVLEALANGSDDDDLTEEEERRMEVATRKRGPRRAVIGERLQPSLRFFVNAKTTVQRVNISSSMTQHFLFKGIPAAHFAQVLDAFQGPVELEAGDEVMRQGNHVSSKDPGMYILESGELDVYQAADVSVKAFPGKLVDTYTVPGQLFGGLALFHNTARTATVMARTPATVWWIDRESFNNVVRWGYHAQRRRRERLLETANVFQDLSREDRAKIADVLVPMSFDKGENIITAGDIGSEMYIVEVGYAEVVVKGKSVREYSPGDYFGEFAFLHSKPRSADVVAAATPTKVMALDGNAFRRLVYAPEALRGRSNTDTPASSVSRGEDDGCNDVDGADEDDDSEDIDEEEMTAMRTRVSMQGQRSAIVGDTITRSKDFRPPMHQKTPEQRLNIKAAISNSTIFGSLTDAVREQVIDALAGPHYVSPDTEVIRQGATVGSGESGVYILERGSLAVYKAKPGERYPGTKVKTYDGAGQHFGELALLFTCPRAATVISTTTAVLWSLDRDTFNGLVKNSMMEFFERCKNLLRMIPLMQDLSESEIDKIADVVYVRNYNKGDKITQRGDAGNELFIVEEGAAAAFVGPMRMKEYGVGGYFGELALLQKQPRSADVVADTTPTICLVVDGDGFRRLLGPALREQLKGQANTYIDTTPAVSMRPKGVNSKMWVCTARGCGFENFSRATHCLKCNQSRTHVPVAAIEDAPQGLPPAASDEPPHFTTLNVEIARGGPNIVLASYVDRRPDAGVVQGLSPLAPGEKFKVTVSSLGTFGEVGVGLSPQMTYRQYNSGAPPLSTGEAKPTDFANRGAMVGWSQNEVGFHGDHGCWYLKGKCPGKKVTPPWECGDVIVCGLSLDGRVFVELNGHRVVEGSERWPMEHGYPTATFRSVGAELVVDLSGILRKQVFGVESVPGSPLPSPMELLHKLQGTTNVQKKSSASTKNPHAKVTLSHGLSSLSRWFGFWCTCEEIEIASGS